MKRIKRFKLMPICMLLAIMLGCGGGGDAPPAKIVGVAAAGAPLSGTVFLKDSSVPAQELTQNTAADGSFSFDVAALNAPFILKAVGTSGGQNYTLYSLKSGYGIGNVNPLSHLAVSQVLGGADPSTLYNAPNPATMQTVSTNLPQAVADIQSALAQLFTLVGAPNADFISGQFTANHEGVDLLMDLVSISVNAGTVNITNRATNAVILTSSLSSGTIEGQIDEANLPDIPLPGSSFTISGKVTDVAGAGISGVEIAMENSTVATTDASGSYSITGVKVGSYTLTASKDGSVFHPQAQVLVNANVTQDFLSINEETAVLPGGQFFNFIGGVTPGGGGMPNEIMYDDTEGKLILLHAYALKVDAAYASNIRATYGPYLSSNDVPPPDFPATAGTVYIMRSTKGPGGQADPRYYKLQIDSATLKEGDTRGEVTFRYAQILPLDIVDAVGEWEFPDGAHFSVLPDMVLMDYMPQPGDPMWSIQGYYTDRSTLEGIFTVWNPDKTTGAVTVTLEVTEDGKLNVSIVGDAPLGSVTLTGGEKQP